MRALRIAAILLSLVIVAGLLAWQLMILSPSEFALSQLESDEQVTVSERDGYLLFRAEDRRADRAVVFYPGGGVDYRSYSPLMRHIARQGYQVALLEVPLSLALLAPDAADRVIGQLTGVRDWYVAGHSLGGLVAADYVATRGNVRGLILLASRPGNDALRASSLPVLSISASEDGLNTREDIAASRAWLPPGTRFSEIQGGNHAQFGSYGDQVGDGPAIISSQHQWEQVALLMDEWVLSLENPANSRSAP